MDRITIKTLRALCERLNRETDSPLEPYTRDATGRFVANVGNYHISQAYGGYCLHRMVGETGGVTCPLYSGHIPARDLYERMHAYLRGMDDARHGVAS
jgi:hypothetical protein